MKIATVLGTLVLLLLLFGVLWPLIEGRMKKTPDRQLVYKKVDKHELELHVFFPPVMEGNSVYPLLLMFHGGGWQYGHPRQFYPQCQHFSQMGIVCVSAEYRIESRHSSLVSSSVEDARDALAWLLDNAGELSIDPEKLVVAGGSSGAQLAFMTLVGSPWARQNPSLRGNLILYNPILNLEPGRPDHDRVGDDWQTLSPYHLIGKPAPHVMILSGTADAEVPIETLEEFCEKVAAYEGICDLHTFLEADHGFFNPDRHGARFYKQTNGLIQAHLENLGFIVASLNTTTDQG